MILRACSVCGSVSSERLAMLDARTVGGDRRSLGDGDVGAPRASRPSGALAPKRSTAPVRGLPGVHRHPQPLRREGACGPGPAHEGAAGDHPGGLRPGRDLGGARETRGARRLEAEALRAPRGLRRRLGLVIGSGVPAPCRGGEARPGRRLSRPPWGDPAMGHGRRGPARGRGGSGRDAGAAAPVAGRGRLRHVHGPHLSALLLRRHRGADRPRTCAGLADRPSWCTCAARATGSSKPSRS
jgi:hypothetical protein